MELDYIDAHELASLADGTDGAEVTAQQNARQMAWLKRAAGCDSKSWRPAKRRRVAAYTWTRVLETQIVWSTDLGFEQFVPTSAAPDAQDLLQWKRLVVSPDKGADIVSASNYMLGPLQMNCMFAWDPSHGCQTTSSSACRMQGCGCS